MVVVALNRIKSRNIFICMWPPDLGGKMVFSISVLVRVLLLCRDTMTKVTLI